MSRAGDRTGNGGIHHDTQPPIQIQHHYHNEHLTYPLSISTTRIEELLEMVVMHQQSELQRFEQTGNQIEHLLEEIKHMSAVTDRLARELEETKVGVDSTVLLLGRISDFIREHAGEEEVITRFADDLDATQRKLADAVAAVPAFGVTPPVDNPPVDNPPVEELPTEPQP